MGWERDDADASVTFFCDSLDCKSVLIYPSGTSFVECWNDASTHMNWRSFKRMNRPWEYFCAGCAADAETAYHEHNKQEQERERIKARNSY